MERDDQSGSYLVPYYSKSCTLRDWWMTYPSDNMFEPENNFSLDFRQAQKAHAMLLDAANGQSVEDIDKFCAMAKLIAQTKLARDGDLW